MTLFEVSSKDGTRIVCEETGHGPPVVLVHGTAADRTRWAPLAPRLAERFTVLAMDRRGRGASGDGPAYAFEREFEDVAAVIEAAGEPVFLLGHSHGAICSLEALLLTDRVRRAVLYEPPVPTDEIIVEAGIVEELEALLAAGDRDAVVETFFRRVVKMPPAELALARSLPAWQGRVASAHTIPREERVYVLGAAEQYRLRPERFESVHVPTLLLQGGDSPSFFRKAVAAVHEALPQSRVVVLAGQQHTAINTAPELFLKEVLGFFAGP